MTPRAIAALSHAGAMAELSRLYGHDADPKRGAMHTRLCLDNAKVLVEYEFVGDDAETNILGVLVNGAWVDAGAFDEVQVGEWVDAIDEETRTDSRRRLEDAQADAQADAREPA